MIITSHSLRELEDFCDKYAMIDNKRIAHCGDITDSVASICKFELAFSLVLDKKNFDHLHPLRLEQNGRFVRIVLECDSETARARLNELSPLVIEELPVNFEEAFISRVERRERE